MQLSLSKFDDVKLKQTRSGSEQRMRCTAVGRPSAAVPTQVDRGSELSSKFAAALSAIAIANSVISPVAMAQEPKLAEQVLDAVGNNSGLVNTVINGCNSGWTSGPCKSALKSVSELCTGNKSNCVKLVVDVCQKNKTVCKKASGPLCKATGSYAEQCKLAVKAATSPVGGLAVKLLGGR